MTGAQLDLVPLLCNTERFSTEGSRSSWLSGAFTQGKYEPLQTGSTSLTLSFSKATATHFTEVEGKLAFSKDIL